jgi:acetoin utilization protein AcuB
MADLSIQAWITIPPAIVSPKESLRRAREFMRAAKVTELLVVDGGKLVGTVSERDIWEHCPTSALVMDNERAEDLLEQFRVGGVMALHPPVITPDTLLPEAAQLLAQSGRSGLPVVINGVPVGFLTEARVMQAIALLLGGDSVLLKAKGG